jgi:methylisocitrate lyase
MTPGQRLRQAIALEQPLQIAGTINAFCALLAEQSGFRAIYLSGAGVANASHGLPDLGITTLHDVIEDARRITSVTSLPLLVDVDTGWGGDLMVQRTVREMARAGVAGIHLEDQVDQKRCGHRPNKQLVSTEQMKDRLKSAVDARTDDNFVVMARTDAAAGEGIQSAIDRSRAYTDAGADMIFAEALTTLDEFCQFTEAISVPVLANITEFGRTPMFTIDELRVAGVAVALYPLTAFRAMAAAALQTYSTIRNAGTQRDLIESMQTREQLYDVLNYLVIEQQQDERQR